MDKSEGDARASPIGNRMMALILTAATVAAIGAAVLAVLWFSSAAAAEFEFRRADSVAAKPSAGPASAAFWCAVGVLGASFCIYQGWEVTLEWNARAPARPHEN